MNFLREIQRKFSGNNGNNEAQPPPASQDGLKRKHSATRKCSSEAPEKKLALIQYLWDIKRKLSGDRENSESHYPQEYLELFEGECTEFLEFATEATEQRLAAILYLEELRTKYQLDEFDVEDPETENDSEGSQSKKKKAKALPILGVQGSSKELPSLDIMGIPTGMKPDHRQLPEGFKLGNLAEFKFAGLVQAKITDRFEVQIYCNLFEQFSYYPYYRYSDRTWITAHELAVQHIIQYRVPPYIRLCITLKNPNIQPKEKPQKNMGLYKLM